MRKFWCLFFMFWPIAAVIYSAMSPSFGHWFPGPSVTVLGEKIDNLFYLILIIVTVVFVGTQIALGYVLWKSSHNQADKAWFSHGSARSKEFGVRRKLLAVRNQQAEDR